MSMFVRNDYVDGVEKELKEKIKSLEFTRDELEKFIIGMGKEKETICKQNEILKRAVEKIIEKDKTSNLHGPDWTELTIAATQALADCEKVK